MSKFRLAHWKAEALKARERLAFIVAMYLDEMDGLIKERDQWKARSEALEQILLRTLKCEFGSPTDNCPWWAAYCKKEKLPKLVRVVQRGTPRKGWFFASDWVCEACLKARKNYKLESDPIGKAGR